MKIESKIAPANRYETPIGAVSPQKQQQKKNKTHEIRRRRRMAKKFLEKELFKIRLSIPKRGLLSQSESKRTADEQNGSDDEKKKKHTHNFFSFSFFVLRPQYWKLALRQNKTF